MRQQAVGSPGIASDDVEASSASHSLVVLLPTRE
jgi:hypothetical protein